MKTLLGKLGGAFEVVLAVAIIAGIAYLLYEFSGVIGLR